MPELPIRRMILYKHGVGYFERRGSVSGTELRLSFPRAAMDDVLKSLVALDLGDGQIHGVDFETPEDRAAQIARGSIHLSDDRSLLDLLRDLRGRRVRLFAGKDSVEGQVLGVDVDEARRAVLGGLEVHAQHLPGAQVQRHQAFEHIVHGVAREAELERRARERPASLEVAYAVLVDHQAADGEVGHCSAPCKR